MDSYADTVARQKGSIARILDTGRLDPAVLAAGRRLGLPWSDPAGTSAAVIGRVRVKPARLRARLLDQMRDLVAGHGAVTRDQLERLGWSEAELAALLPDVKRQLRDEAELRGAPWGLA